MPSTLFDSAGLAIVAYVQVDGATGSSTSTARANSGVSTTRINKGNYAITVPTAIGQDPSRDLIFVQPTNSGATFAYPPGTMVTDEDDHVKYVTIGTLDPAVGGTTAMDCDFNLLILRTILP